MAHYSSQFACYEGGAKNPLKSTSVKLLVLASYAQFGVSAGRKSFWAIAMACGKRPNHSLRPILVVYLIYYELGLNLLCGYSYE